MCFLLSECKNKLLSDLGGRKSNQGQINIDKPKVARLQKIQELRNMKNESVLQVKSQAQSTRVMTDWVVSS